MTGRDPDAPMTADAAECPAAVKALLVEGYNKVLEAFQRMGYAVDGDDNFTDTADRAARAAMEMVRPVEAINAEVDEMLLRTFSARYEDMVISKHNICFGICPHHLLPVVYRVSVAYLPDKRVLGISKLSRLVTLLARRPVLQEDLTQELSEILHQRLETRGSACYIEGLHMCMAARGIQAHEARVVTSGVRGVFRDHPATRQEFLDLVTAAPLNLL